MSPSHKTAAEEAAFIEGLKQARATLRDKLGAEAAAALQLLISACVLEAVDRVADLMRRGKL